MARNSLVEKLRAKKKTFGTWVTIGNPDIPDVLQGLGFDWFVFDTEHSPISLESVSHMIQVLD